MNFMECARCAAKPGAPDLCESCLHNRAIIRGLQGGQHVGPSVGPIARLQQANRDLIAKLKQGNRDMKADVELLKKDIRCLENTIERLKAETELLRHLPSKATRRADQPAKGKWDDSDE